MVPALNDINLTIRAGEMVALVGIAVAVEKRLWSILSHAFTNRRAGRILIDGVDIQSYTLRSL